MGKLEQPQLCTSALALGAPPQALAAAVVAFGRERVPLSEETLASCFAAPQD